MYATFAVSPRPANSARRPLRRVYRSWTARSGRNRIMMFPKSKKSSKSKPLDTSGFPFPKPSRVKSKPTIDKSRKKSCEVCGSTKGLVVHHVFTRGSGAPDLKENLLCLCVDCHAEAHSGQIAKEDLLGVISEREGKSVEEIRKLIGQAMGREYA